jgi:protoporphyrinogen/coproporphyrinogen III oxidase
VQVDPQTLTARVLDDLRVLLGAQGEPTFRAVQVWPKAIPQYVLGYGRFKDIADEVERRNPGLVLAGTYRDGVSLGEAIGSGERAATRVAELLGVEPVNAGSKRPARTASAAGQD